MGLGGLPHVVPPLHLHHGQENKKDLPIREKKNLELLIFALLVFQTKISF
jgi:hypothetical protein